MNLTRETIGLRRAKSFQAQPTFDGPPWNLFPAAWMVAEKLSRVPQALGTEA